MTGPILNKIRQADQNKSDPAEIKVFSSADPGKTAVSDRNCFPQSDGNESVRTSIQEEILQELRAVNEILKEIANSMESMEKNFWT